MVPYEYNKNKFISEGEFTFAIPSLIIGVAVLSLPSDVASVTSYSDGWVSILIAGILATMLAILAVKVAMNFPGQPFYSYASYLLTKPIAIMVSLIYVIFSVLFAAYGIRSAAFITQEYLFYRTPLEVLALCFLLVVIYAVSGKTVGIFRLNIMFLPIILFIFIFVGILNIQFYEADNFLPLFKTNLTGYMKGIRETFNAFSGFGIGLFYIYLVHNPKKMTKKVVTGMSIVVIFYLFIFFASIGIFGPAVTKNLMFPTIELAKRVDIPGGIFERIDAIVFTIWLMAIFNTIAIILNVAILIIKSVFKKINKRILAFILSPIIFYLSMFLQQLDQITKVAKFLSTANIVFISLLIIVLFLMVKIRGVKHNET